MGRPGSKHSIRQPERHVATHRIGPHQLSTRHRYGESEPDSLRRIPRKYREVERELTTYARDRAADDRRGGADGHVQRIRGAGRRARVGEGADRRAVEEEGELAESAPAEDHRRAILDRRRGGAGAIDRRAREAAHAEGAPALAHAVRGDDAHRTAADAADL